MKTLRPECVDGRPGTAIPDDTALFLIRDAVERRRRLIHGQLHQNGDHCALGAFWTDNPRTTINSTLVEEVAAVNDSIPPTATPQERWKKVRSWLRWKIKALAGAKAK